MVTDTAALIAEIQSLPDVPSIVAKSVLIAQSVKLSDDDKVAIEARRAFFAKMGMPESVSLPVFDLDGVRIGELRF